MKIAILALLLPLLAAAQPADPSPHQIQHPRTDIRVTVRGDWRLVPFPGDADVMDLTRPDEGLQVLVWTTETEMTGLRYLRKMAGMKAFSPEVEIRACDINGRDAWAVWGPGRERGRDVRTYLAVIDDTTRLILVQAWCRPDDWQTRNDELWRIVTSVVVPTEAMAAFGATDHDVRSVSELDVDELNARIAAGVAAGACWTEEAMLIALHFAGEAVQSMKKTVTVDCPGERYEQPDQGVIVVTVTELGFLDDAIGGERRRTWLARNDDGLWTVQRALRAQLCRRLDQVYWSGGACP